MSSFFSWRAVSLWLIGRLGTSLSAGPASDGLESSVVVDGEASVGTCGGESSGDCSGGVWLEKIETYWNWIIYSLGTTVNIIAGKVPNPPSILEIYIEELYR